MGQPADAAGAGPVGGGGTHLPAQQVTDGEDLWAYHRDAVMRFDVVTGDLIDVFISDGLLNGPTAVAFIPEPATLWLMTFGGLILIRRRRYGRPRHPSNTHIR